MTHEIAYGSLMEVYCQLCIAMDLNYITSQQLEVQKQKIDGIAGKLNALNRAYQKRL